jgi:hypothetical protein
MDLDAADGTSFRGTANEALARFANKSVIDAQSFQLELGNDYGKD